MVGAVLLSTLVPLGGALVTSSPASATTLCSSGSTTSSCSSTGTLTLTGGSLSITAPSSLAWSATLSGLNLNLVDSTPADQGYIVDDATGSGAGWRVTLAATTFTNVAGHTLSDTGTFSMNGSVTSSTATTAPSTACVSVGDCSLPTNTTGYPVAVTTAASSPTPVTVYDTSANTGMGSVQIGGSGSSNPVGWWLNVPPTAYSGSYTSTLTFSIVSGP